MWLTSKSRRARRGAKPSRLSWTPAVESLDPRTLLAAGPLGINVDFEYVDAMKSAPDWTSVNNVPLTRDANGWPTSDAEIAVMDVRVNQPWNGPDPNAVQPDISGTYSLSFQGSATVAAPGWIGTISVQNQVYNAATNTTTANVVVGAGTGLLVLDFTHTVDPASATGAGVTNVKLIRPGYAANTTQLFTNRFLADIQPFNTLRYLDVDGANSYQAYTDSTDTTLTTLNWSQRRLPSESSQADSYNGLVGESWEYMVALANQTNTDLWINIPGPATDDYVAQLANLIKNGDTVNGVTYAGLNPGLKVYLEYSNEVWGGIWNTYQYNSLEARAEVAAGGSVLNNDGSTDPNVWNARRYLERSMQVTNIFRSVFGNDPSYSVIRPVLGWQEGMSNYYQTTFPWFESTFGAPDRWFYGMGAADYYSATDTSSVNAIISSLQQSESSTYVTAQQFTTLSTFYGMKNVAYEGGPSLGSSNAAAGQNSLAASRDPRMEAIVEQSQDDFYAAGGSQANFYDGPFGGWSPQNIWTAAETAQASNPSASPKYRGLTDLAAQSPVAVTAGFAVSPTALTILPDQYDSLTQAWATPSSGSRDFWLLNVPTAGTYTLSLDSTAQGRAAGVVQVYLNDVAVGGPATLNSGSTTLATLSLPAGLSTIAIATIHGYGDPSQPSTPSYYQFATVALTLAPQAVPVALNDGSFEATQVTSGVAVDPNGGSWNFSGAAGLATAWSPYLGSVQPAQGSQVGFVQTGGSISQAIDNLGSTGNFKISLSAAQAATSLTNLGIGGTVTASTSNNGNGPNQAFDGYTTSNWIYTGASAWIQDQLRGQKLVTEYTLTNDSGYANRSPVSWTLQGSNNGSSWTNLDIESNQIDTNPADTRTYQVPVPGSYSYYRLTISANNSANLTELSEIQLLGPTNPMTNVGLTGQATASGSTSGNSPAQAFDGNAATSWIVAASTGWIQDQLSGSRTVSQYAITTSNSTATYPVRAPKSWQLLGSNDGQNWTVLDTETNQADTANSDRRTYTVASPGSYLDYRLNITANNGGTAIQLGEVQLLTAPTGVVSNVPMAGTTTASATATGYTPAQAFDGSGSSYWAVNSGTGWIQDQLSGGATVVSQYALTSSSNVATYPKRAPSSWQLLGSNDGKSWAVLDTETNQADTANSDTRMYSIASPGSYSYYRLNITANNGGGMIQVGDLQLLAGQAVSSGSESVQVYLDSQLVGTFTTTSTGFTTFTTSVVAVSPGLHIITLKGVTASGAGNALLLDNALISGS